METELREVDAKFSRLHGVPAGRALDLYGRVVGAPMGLSPEAALPARHHDVRNHRGCATIRCAQ